VLLNSIHCKSRQLAADLHLTARILAAWLALPLLPPSCAVLAAAGNNAVLYDSVSGGENLVLQKVWRVMAGLMVREPAPRQAGASLRAERGSMP